MSAEYCNYLAIKLKRVEYKATLDTRAKIITVTAFLLLAAMVYYIPMIRLRPAISVSIAVLLFIFFLLSYLFAPSKYILQEDTLLIIRPASKVKLPIADITAARLVSEQELGTLNRISGSIGLFGYYGIFRSTRLGKLRLYTTRRNNRILISTVDDERILISPDDTSLVTTLQP